MLNVIGFDNFIFALLCLMATWSSGTVFGTYSTLQKINAEQHIGIMGTKAPPPSDNVLRWSSKKEAETNI